MSVIWTHFPTPAVLRGKDSLESNSAWDAMGGGAEAMLRPSGTPNSKRKTRPRQGGCCCKRRPRKARGNGVSGPWEFQGISQWRNLTQHQLDPKLCAAAQGVKLNERCGSRQPA